ncbi:MAG TPA: C2H2-type zinc finger protein [Nitrososphaera sp.]|jgi:hypothetical protein|nr:C2H2-type zinc finger protein [Nitrososphaera sp.]
MTRRFSKCEICGQFFDSKKELKNHKNKSHRITDSRMNPIESLTALLITTIPEWLSDVLEMARSAMV